MNNTNQLDSILPPKALTQAWSPAHLRLHRLLLRQPQLLPAQTTLLLAVSGGQDSMALLGLLLGLRRLHGWGLRLWHGDHGWRSTSAHQAQQLAGWCRAQGLELTLDCHAPAVTDSGNAEAEARAWRYARLEAQARDHGCSRVVSGHTASDRAETLLLHLARGSHRRGLASLRPLRPLGSGPVLLSRPLLVFGREETARICEELGLPIWIDASNADAVYSRNRVRLRVLPELEAIHPGATRRLSATAERLAREHDAQEQWVMVALQWLTHGAEGLDRSRLTGLDPINQAAVLALWLHQHGHVGCSASTLSTLVDRVQQGQPPGCWHLQRGWRLRWDRTTLTLVPPCPAPP